MNTFADAWAIVKREFEIFAYGEGHMLDVIGRCPSEDRPEMFNRLSDNVLIALRREMPNASERLRVIYRDLVMDPVSEKITWSFRRRTE